MIARAAVAPRVIEQLVVGLDMAPRQALFADELLQRGCGENPPRKAQTADDSAPVGFFREIAGLIAGMSPGWFDLAST